MWNAWKTLFMEIVDKHSPFKTKRISKKHSPWITYDLMRKIRNYLTEKKDIENNTESLVISKDSSSPRMTQQIQIL